MVQESDGICSWLQQNFFHLLWDILLLNTLAEIIGHKAVFNNRTIFQNVQVGLLEHGVIELTLLRITISILQNLNNAFVSITIYLVVVIHYPSMKRIERSNVFFQGCLSANGQYAVVVQRVFADAFLCLDLQFETRTKLDVSLYILTHKTALIEQRLWFVRVIVQSFTQNVFVVELDIVVISGAIGIEWYMHFCWLIFGEHKGYATANFDSSIRFWHDQKTEHLVHGNQHIRLTRSVWTI